MTFFPSFCLLVLHQKQVIILIDEYDALLNQFLKGQADPGERSNILNLLQVFFAKIKLFMGTSIELCMLTGVLRAALDDISSSFNIVKDVSQLVE
jgi:hypothetical protein